MNSEYNCAEIYPSDALEVHQSVVDAIHPDVAKTLPGLFNERIKRTPDDVAYLQFIDNQWQQFTWQQFHHQWRRWHHALHSEGLEIGDRVAIRLKNCIEWVLFDQAAMAAGLVVVPVFAEDRADNIAYIIEQTQSKIFLVENVEQWLPVADESESVDSIQRVVVLSGSDVSDDPRVVAKNDWLPTEGQEIEQCEVDPHDLATIVFTSGTTGKPKGVMLSHNNMLQTAYGGLQSVAVFPSDRMLSFLPLSHMFERTIGCYFNVMAGSSVAFNRSIPQLLEDMAEIKPTVIITVPRIFERAYSTIKAQLDEGSGVKRWLFNKAVTLGWRNFEVQQGRATANFALRFQPLLDQLVGSKVRQRFGGNLRFVVSGGAPLSAKISEVFIGLGIDILQGYGLTETSPVLTVNTIEKNKPDSIGLPIASAKLRTDGLGELQASGPSIMLGYWKNQDATKETMTEDGWLKTGDIAKISEEGFISITGRIKEIIVLANGEKLPPADMESAICDDLLFEQGMVIGEGKPYLSAIIVLNKEMWERLAPATAMSKTDEEYLCAEDTCAWVLERMSHLIADFPGYANIRAVTLTLDPWTVENGILTPTLKIKRPVIRERFSAEIEAMYQGH